MNIQAIDRRMQKGFTLIELMVVVAIIGILASIAVQQYQGYLIRSKLAAAAASTGALRTAAAEQFQSNGSFPDSAALGSAGINIIAPAGATVAIVGGASSVITLSFTATLGATVPVGSTLVFTSVAAPGDSLLSWAVTQTGMSGAAADFVATKLNGV